MLIFVNMKSFLRNIVRQYRVNRFDTPTPDTAPAIGRAFERTRGLPGDYYEFGLFKGWSFAKAHDFADNRSMHFFGFDSFEGLPDVVGIDAGDKFTKGKYACSLEKVRKNLGRRITDRTHFYKGYYDELLPTVEGPFGPARIVLVDCDLYSSTVPVMEFIYPYLQNGTNILFDDWNCFSANAEKGERRAVDEFCKAHPNVHFGKVEDYGYHGATFTTSII